MRTVYVKVQYRAWWKSTWGCLLWVATWMYLRMRGHRNKGLLLIATPRNNGNRQIGTECSASCIMRVVYFILIRYYFCFCFFHSGSPTVWNVGVKGVRWLYGTGICGNIHPSCMHRTPSWVITCMHETPSWVNGCKRCLCIRFALLTR